MIEVGDLGNINECWECGCLYIEKGEPILVSQCLCKKCKEKKTAQEMTK